MLLHLALLRAVLCGIVPVAEGELVVRVDLASAQSFALFEAGLILERAGLGLTVGRSGDVEAGLLRLGLAENRQWHSGGGEGLDAVGAGTRDRPDADVALIRAVACGWTQPKTRSAIESSLSLVAGRRSLWSNSSGDSSNRFREMATG